MSSDNERPKVGQSALDPGARPRRSTLETFNEELAVLDRPIEGDVEYYDEIPPIRRLRLRLVAAAVFAVAGGGLLALSGHHPGAPTLLPSAQAVAQSRAPIAAAGVAASTPPLGVPATTPMAPSAPAIAPIGTSAVPSATEPTATRTAASRAVWAKNLHLAGQHHKHGRSTGKRSSGPSGRRRG